MSFQSHHTYLATGGGGEGGEAAAMDYEIPLNSSQNEKYRYEEYSRLQH
jgi:hypothetical protein